MSEPVVIKLRKPVTFGSKVIDTITLRPLKGKDMRRLKESDGNVGNALNFASILSGELPEVIDEIEGEDLGAVMSAVNDFFLAIRGTGGTSSGT